MILKNKNDFKEQGKLAEENAEMSSPIKTSQTTLQTCTCICQPLDIYTPHDMRLEGVDTCCHVISCIVNLL